MNILWIPHCPWSCLEGQREWHFIRRLRHEHTIHVITWERGQRGGRMALLRPDVHWRSLRQWTLETEGITLHHIRRCFDPSRLLTRDDSKILPLNQWFLRSSVRRIARKHHIEVMICGANQYAVGFPPFDLPIPFLFDYMDQYTNPWVSATYLRHAGAVSCSSEPILEESRRHNSSVYYVPNGVDQSRFAQASGHNVRASLGLDGEKVVSLIGLTCSPRLYFLDAIAEAQARGLRMKLLAVGEGPLLDAMQKRAHELNVKTAFTGWVRNAEIHEYFAASDVGLYPVEKNGYYDGALPLKVLEYTAAQRPVVATDLKTLRRLAFPNVYLAEPSASDFADKLVKALSRRQIFPDLTAYDWDDLTRKLVRILQRVIH